MYYDIEIKSPDNSIIATTKFVSDDAWEAELIDWLRANMPEYFERVTNGTLIARDNAKQIELFDKETKRIILIASLKCKEEKKYTKFRDIPKFISDGNYAVDYPFVSLIHFLDGEEREMGLQLCPDFQRGHVWTEEQQKKYIEFLLRGGKTGRDLYFNNPSWHRQAEPGAYNDYVCVDGLQRITAIRKFINNQIQVFGSYFYEFTDSMRFFEDTMRIHVNDLKTKADVLRWYIEMNAGGTPHSVAEIERVQKMLNDEEANYEN